MLERSNSMKETLRFHSFHGSGVELTESESTARCNGHHCSGFVFSNQPLRRDRAVCVDILVRNERWSNVLGEVRVGVTSEDPSKWASLQQLPHYLCPHFLHSNKLWARSLPDVSARDHCRILLCVRSNGKMTFSLNGANATKLLTDLPVSSDLWLVLEVLASTASVKLSSQGIQ